MHSYNKFAIHFVKYKMYIDKFEEGVYSDKISRNRPKWMIIHYTYIIHQNNVISNCTVIKMFVLSIYTKRDINFHKNTCYRLPSSWFDSISMAWCYHNVWLVNNVVSLNALGLRVFIAKCINTSKCVRLVFYCLYFTTWFVCVFVCLGYYVDFIM